MKTLVPVCCSLAAFCLVPSAVAQKEAPGGTPAQPSDAARPDSKEGSDRDRKHDAAMNPATEADFVKTAAKKGMAEVKMAQLGIEKADDAKVKELAQLLVKDHTAANTQLKTVAEGLNIKLADTPDEKAQQKHNELNGRSGKEFDQAFLDHMARGHEKSIALYEAGRKVAKSEQVIAYIDKILPVIKNHAEKISQLHTGGVSNDPKTTPKVEDRPGSQPQPGTNRR